MQIKNLRVGGSRDVKWQPIAGRKWKERKTEALKGLLRVSEKGQR